MTNEASEKSERPAGPTVVGIGASAGGLGALREFFSHVPKESGLSFVVVMHLSPEHESHLTELLQPHVAIPVQQVTETVALEPNRVYVIPPNRNLTAIDSHLRLTELEEQRRHRAPIDHFFRTLARAHDGRGIAVILTGTGNDGALGLRDVKDRGGLTIVQDPNEAEFDGMPIAALATGVVDLVLPVAEMPEAIARFVRTTPRVAVPPEDGDLEDRERQLVHRIFALVLAGTGRDFARYKRSTIMRRIVRRMQLVQREELGDYVELLRERPEEVRALADDLLITVTNFFRDAAVFERLQKDIIPSLLERTGMEDEIRVWSVGCATGEEAYSLAILLLEEVARRETAVRIQVFASDLHERSLLRAREGFYAGDIEADVSPARLRRWFHKEEGGYRIRKEVRDVVVFAPHNLLGDPPFSRLDLITCRNVLIYLQPPAQRGVLELFHYALRPEGYLILGSSETKEGSELFLTEDKRLSIYRKRHVPGPELRLPVFSLMRATPARATTGLGDEIREPTVYGPFHYQALERLGPPSILVSPDDRALHLSENAGRYLVHPGGNLTANVLRLVREELRIELRAALHGARERKRATTTRPIAMRLDGGSVPVMLHVQPALDPKEEGFALVVFLEGAPERLPTAGEGGAQAEGSEGESVRRAERLQELEAELLLTRQRLQAIIEEYETSQEEMKAANEELQSTNEELRSTMEELETGKEELQSVNEELQTVNQENRHKVEELAQLSADLQNLLTATDIATLFLDRDCCILRFTPRVGELFNVRTTDRGRPLSDLTHRLKYPELRQDAEAVLARLVTVERELRDEEGRWYLTRLSPYRSAEDRIKGVVITFVDVTASKRAEYALRESEERLRQTLLAAQAGCWTYDPAQEALELDRGARLILGVSANRIRREDLWALVHVEDRERWTRALSSGTFGGGKRVSLSEEFRILRSDGGLVWVQARGRVFADLPAEDAGDHTGLHWQGVLLDVTERKLVEQRKDSFLAMLAHELRNPLATLQTGLSLLERDREGVASERTRHMMQRQLGQLVRLVDDLLDTSKIGQGMLDLRWTRVDLGEIVRQGVEAARLSEDRRVDVALPKDPVVVRGDLARLGQVFGNLLGNAHRFTRSGEVISVSVARDAEEAVLRVDEEGTNLPSDELSAILESFQSGATPSRQARDGVGIGLSLVRSLVELHGGTIHARLRDGGPGSTFEVRLPITNSLEDAEGGGDGLPGGDARAPRISRRVLIVDDNEDAAMALGMLLGQAGHQIRLAYDGATAVRQAREFVPDAILLDIGLPRLDGYEVARAVRSEPWGARIPIIAVTGWGQPVDKKRSQEAGIDRHFVKPADPRLLERTIAELAAARDADRTESP